MICLDCLGLKVLSFPQRLLNEISILILALIECERSSLSSKSWKWNGGGLLWTCFVVCLDGRNWELHGSQIQFRVTFFVCRLWDPKKSHAHKWGENGSRRSHKKANVHWVLRKNFFSQENMVGRNKNMSSLHCPGE